jgi:hypothetical protein
MCAYVPGLAVGVPDVVSQNALLYLSGDLPHRSVYATAPNRALTLL